MLTTVEGYTRIGMPVNAGRVIIAANSACWHVDCRAGVPT